MIVGGLWIGTYHLWHVISGKADDTAVAKTAPSKTTPQLSPVKSASLASMVDAILQQNNSDQIGIALEDVSDRQTQSFGITAPFEAASTAKLITAATYYHLVETGDASLTAPLGDYDAQFQIKSMINQSNNDSWSLLVAAVGEDRLQAYATSIGLDYDVANNTLSPSSMATFLGKLYIGKLLNQIYTQQLLSYMQNTNDEDLIPAAVSSDITVYHKYGLLNGELHDVAIVTKDGKSYVLAIYTKNSDDSDDAARTTVIHQLTQAITSSLYS
jgi:beta-lactamase class A